MKEKRNLRIIILFSVLISMVIIFIFLYFFIRLDSTSIRPVKGVLDLKAWDAKADGAVTLKGQWDFYWKRFLSYQDALAGHTTPDVEADIPGVWNNYRINNEKLSGYGYGTYLLEVVNAPKGEPLALSIPTFSTAYELYINDRLVASNGKVGTNREQHLPEYKPLVVEFTPETSDFMLIIHVSNFTYARGGMWNDINLGTPKQIRSLNKIISDKDLYLIGALSVMAFYYLCIFMLRREDKSSLYFVLMCLIFACRITVLGDYLIYRLVPSISFHVVIILEYLTIIWFSVSAVLMVKQLFREEFPTKALKLFCAYGFLASAFVIFTPIVFFTNLIIPIQFMAVAIGIYGIGCLVIAFIHGKNEAGVIFIGGVALALAAIHDIMYNNSVILSSTGEWVAWAQFILVLSQAFILARRFSSAFKSVNTLSQRLIKLDKVKDEFLANTSHELRTPLSSILGITEAMLKGSTGELSSLQKQELSTVAGSSRRLTNLVNDILDYSKMKNGDILLNISPVHLDGLINSVVNVFRKLSQTAEYEVVAEIPEALPPVMADENRVIQILYNLMGNAVKFTVKGSIKISAIKKGNILEICVSDTGIGIPKDRLEDVFKSFEQVDTSLTRRYGGTGLGLSISKRLVELQNGTIWAESQLGVGSSFRFTLPIATETVKEYAASQEMPELKEKTISPPPAGIINEEGSPLVLLVDDDIVSLHASAAVLRIDGYAIITVSNGSRALEVLQKHKDISLMILDVMMPEMSGYEVCRKLRESKPLFDLPILMLTARTSTQDIVMSFEAGANDYLPKPFEPEELLARVKTLTMLKASVDRAISAEVGFLQAQIKPHFLFNVLNTIASFCNTDPQYARKLIIKLADYLRQCFDFKSLDMFVPLYKEIGLVQSYVEIEKARFGEKLSVEYDIDRNVETEIFLLSIQPLVENAIRHGLRKKAGKGTVKITVKQVKENVVVSVSDDGCGMSPDKLKTVLLPDNEQGIGLWNIDRRLKKLFGKGLTIESEQGKGTTVMFAIPQRGDLS